MRVASRAAKPPKTLEVRKLGIIRKISKLHLMLGSAQCSSQNQNFGNTYKNYWKTETKLSLLFDMKTRVFLIYFVHDCRCFSVNFAKFLRIPFLQNTSGLLLLNIQNIFSMFACQMRSSMANYLKKLRNQLPFK